MMFEKKRPLARHYPKAMTDEEIDTLFDTDFDVDYEIEKLRHMKTINYNITGITLEQLKCLIERSEGEIVVNIRLGGD